LVATSLQQFCTLQAVTSVETGKILPQNPQPGKRGTIGRQTIELPGRWTFDASMGKTFQIVESKSLQMRFDATNIFNHPFRPRPLSISTTPTSWDTSLPKGLSTANSEDSFVLASEPKQSESWRKRSSIVFECSLWIGFC
jgi:hypothetical protein